MRAIATVIRIRNNLVLIGLERGLDRPERID